MDWKPLWSDNRELEGCSTTHIEPSVWININRRQDLQAPLFGLIRSVLRFPSRKYQIVNLHLRLPYLEVYLLALAMQGYKWQPIGVKHVLRETPRDMKTNDEHSMPRFTTDPSGCDESSIRIASLRTV